MKTITKFIYPAFATLAFACFAICPTAEAVSPAPDGGYAGNNTAEGTSALFSLTSGIDNNGLGFQALYHNRTGSYNAAEGFRALFSNTTGGSNTATGVNALYSNSIGAYNTAVGLNALYHNNNGNGNTALGTQALQNNVSGGGNTAIGTTALFSNTTSSGTTATGYQALYHNTTGPGNTATGYRSLVTNTSGSGNTAIGSQALQANTNNSNTAVGRLALANNTTGSQNIALGEYAGQNITTGGENIDIGNTGVTGDNGIIRIGANQETVFISSRARLIGRFLDINDTSASITNLFNISESAAFIAGISGTQQGGTNIQSVTINSDGQLGTQPTPTPTPSLPSSRRFKKEIKPMEQASEAILSLKPVTFHYKSDRKDTPQFGLIAEEVAEVSPDLVVRDENGEIYTVRYDAVNAMLLNEFLKQHRQVQEQQKEIDALNAALKDQKALIQKVSDKVQLSKPAPQTVANNQ